jgi:hypothetical protein
LRADVVTAPARNPMTSLELALRTYAEAQWKRILTQMDRDPSSPTFGCFDRNYWHYKIRDFPSSLLQQGVFTIDAVRRGVLGGAPEGSAVLDRWCAGALNALERQVNRAGGVDEYYPYEHSYPSAAFGLYAAGRCLFDWRRDAPHIAAGVRTTGLRMLAHHLSARIEQQASNQQAAGLAALALAATQPDLGVDGAVVSRHADRFFAAQHSEGWFDEYGGPDFGYLTVTIDAMVDYHDATGDARALAACDRAIAFLARLIGADGELPWTMNSRNTDYAVPYGMVRRAQENPLAAWVVERLFRPAGDPRRHFLWSTDDRYHCHYIYASVVRALPLLQGMTTPEPPDVPAEDWLDGCGYWIRRGSGWTLYVGAQKGGLVRLHRADQGPLVEHGWRIESQGTPRWSTNWWSGRHTVDRRDASVSIRGSMTGVAYHVPSPLKNAGLRAAAWLFRDRLIPLLKRLMIFRNSSGPAPEFTRTVELDGSRIRIHDEFRNVKSSFTIVRSPRQNLRHVASADSFSPEEWMTAAGQEHILEWTL